ncbi:MAG: translation initiation factor IF-2, partial [Blastocatellia bacterium]
MLEDARRLGVDASVPSNTLPDNIAAKIREMYYPKKEPVAAKPTARLIKHPPPSAASPAPATTPEPNEQTMTPAPALAKSAPQPSSTETSTGSPVSIPTAAPKTTVIKPLTPRAPMAEATPSPIPATASQSQVAQSAAESDTTHTVRLPTPAPFPVPEARQEQELSEAQPGITMEATEAAPVPLPVELSAEVPVTHGDPVVAGEQAQPAEVLATTKLPSITPAAHKPKLSVTATTTTGTNIIKLATPTGPMPKPATRSTSGLAGTGKLNPALLQLRVPGKDAQREGKDKEAHLLPSGAQQRTVYIPPQNQKPKGRNQHRAKDKEKDKFQDGNTQRLGLRRNAFPVTAPRNLVPVELKPLRLIEGSTVREFAEKMEAKPRDIVTALMQRGVMATINQTINHETAIEIGREQGFEISFGDFEDMAVESEFEITPEAMEDTDTRAPVITVMGHVDHGKTSLLDAIRSTRVAEGEAGGITQHIGAYSVKVPNAETPNQLRRVVFLDTPGHEAFTMMRARGAKVTDIVVLVVAADDGVMPQTIEAIEHSRAAKVPIIVAINKTDKPDANPERVKKELADRGVLWSNWGGDTEMIEVSAKKRQNIDSLLEMILLTADILELKSNPKRRAMGTVLEAKLDRGRGPVATVLVQNGSLRVGDPFIAGNFSGKVRAMMNDVGERVQETGPATPVEVLGLEGVPAAGDQFLAVDDVAKAQQIAQFRQSKARVSALERS